MHAHTYMHTRTFTHTHTHTHTAKFNGCKSQDSPRSWDHTTGGCWVPKEEQSNVPCRSWGPDAERGWSSQSLTEWGPPGRWQSAASCCPLSHPAAGAVDKQQDQLKWPQTTLVNTRGEVTKVTDWDQRWGWVPHWHGVILKDQFNWPQTILNSFIPVSYLALLPLIPMNTIVLSFLGFHKKKCMKGGIWVWVIVICKLLVKPWQPIYHCVGKWSQKAMVTLSESLSPRGWHTGANKGDTYLF